MLTVNVYIIVIYDVITVDYYKHPGQRYVNDRSQLLLMAGNIHLNLGPAAKYVPETSLVKE